jgi:hypothetical protein
MLDADVGPGAQVIDRIDDSAADPAVGRAGPEITVLLKGAPREAEKPRGFRCAQEAGRQIGGRIGQVTAPAGGGGRRRNCQNWRGRVGYEDVRLHGCDHPLWGHRQTGRSADTEQFAVVAVHHRDAVSDQPDHERTRGRHLPVARGQSGRLVAPQRDGDLAIGRAAVAQVERAEHKVEPRKPVGGERPTARQWPRRAAEQTAVEAQQAGDAGDEILVERNDGGERAAGLGVTQPQPMLAGRIGDDDVASVDPRLVGEQRAERARIDRGGGLVSLRRGVQDDRDGGQLRAPDDRL